MTLLGRVVYWLAVLAISLFLVFQLLRFFESRDESAVDGPGQEEVTR